MTIFDYLKDILVDKTGNLPLDDYSPYIINRWLSFINPDVAVSILCVGSQDLLMDKQRHYKTLLCCFPKMRRAPRIEYIKKTKEEKQETDDKIAAIAGNLEISKREASYLFEK